jgi:hypothetical protein
MGLKTDGVRCARTGHAVTSHAVATHLHYCGAHHIVYNRRAVAHVAGACHKWIGGNNPHYCGRQSADDGLLCERHIEVERIRHEHLEAQRQANAHVNQVMLWYTQQQPAMNWRQVVDHIMINHADAPQHARWIIARGYFFHRNIAEPDLNQQWQFERYWNWVIRGRIGNPPDLNAPAQWQPVPPPVVNRNGLAAIARDVQNVHTRVVSDQTNKGLEILLEASKADKHMRSPDWFAARWLTKSYGSWINVVRVVNDMQHWYKISTCKDENDRLYQRALDGLFLKLRKMTDTDLQAELFKRAFEECYESVGMCCEGHISRLCNVLVGFDDAFAPPVPFGEILQNKMAAIYALEIETEKKITLATDFFNEFAVPEVERSAWLEAF